MYKRYAAITTIMAGLFALFAPTAGATAPRPASVCDTGHRGQPAYDRTCLRTGNPDDAMMLWYSVDQGSPRNVRDDFTTRRSICKYAARHGGIMVSARELVGDMTYDVFRNDKTVDRWVGELAKVNCTQMGYRV